jgi:hypothetical protein
LGLARNVYAAIGLALLFWASTAFAQSSSEDAPQPIVAPKQASLGEPRSSPEQESDLNQKPESNSLTTALDASWQGSIEEVKQSKRILWGPRATVSGFISSGDDR